MILISCVLGAAALTGCTVQGGGGGEPPKGGSGSGSGSGSLPVHGTVCNSPSDCKSAQTGLTCVVDEPGDTQGVCMLVCDSFSQCLGNSEALSRGDTSCCQVFGGTNVCGNDNVFPEDACQ